MAVRVAVGVGVGVGVPVGVGVGVGADGAVGRIADGAIVASALIDHMEQLPPEQVVAGAAEFVRKLRS